MTGSTATLSERDLDERFAFGMALMEEAEALALGYFERLGSLTVTAKGPQDMASEADLETERMIRARLAERFPDDAFLGEETGRQGVSGAAAIWVVDPIDGTQPFVSGLSGWCVSIALVSDGRIAMGFVSAPARQERFVGRSGHGATLNGQPIQVRANARLTDGLTAVGYSMRVGADGFLPMFERMLRQGATFFREGSGALSLCYVACGRLIGYVEVHINAWDCLGALAVIEAAGGMSNDFLAGEGLWQGNRLVAGPKTIVPVLEALFD